MDYWPYESGIRFPVKGKAIDFPEEFLDSHSLVLGKTGTGKSNMLAHLIRMYEDAGKNVIVFDPHGELWRYGREDSSIVSLSPLNGQSEGFLNFNMMSVLPYSNEKERSINEDLVIQSLKDIFSSEETFSIGTWGPRIELVFTVIPKLLLKYKITPNLQDMLDLLLDYYKRRDFISSLEPSEKMQIYAIFNQGYDFVSSSVNKILPLLSGDVQKKLFSSRNDFYDISKLHGTMYLELSNELSPSSVIRPFSVMILYKLWNNIVLGRMKNTVIVMDEFQTFSPHISHKIVTEGRKFSLWSIMATQSFSNLTPVIRDSLRTNVHNFFLFQLSSDDLNFFNRYGRKLVNPDFHYFNCLIPRTGAIFLGKARLAERKRKFLVDPKFYCFGEESDTKYSTDPKDFDPAYLNHLITLGLASIEDGEIYLSESYFSKVGSRHKRGHESVYHRYLITRSYLFFKARGFEVYENVEIKGKRPDLVLIDGDVKVPVECEYSDLENKKRIFEKVEFYGRVIFSVFQGGEQDIPQGCPILVVPPIGDTSELKFIEDQNVIGTYPSSRNAAILKL